MCVGDFFARGNHRTKMCVGDFFARGNHRTKMCVGDFFARGNHRITEMTFADLYLRRRKPAKQNPQKSARYSMSHIKPVPS